MRTNVGDLTHNFVLRHRADVVAVTETWLTEEVEPTFGKIQGYSHWVRKDRENRAGGGVAACFKDCLNVQKLEVTLPHRTEALFFRVALTDNSGLLLCVMYRPPRQRRAPLDCLTEELDTLLLRHQCSHVMVVGDLNFHLEQGAFDNLLTVQGLVNHVTFPTHERGGLLDPVLSDLPEASLRCQQLGPVGSSDHYAVLARVELTTEREDAVPRTIWLWERADWPSMRHAVEDTDWVTLLDGDAEAKARALTTKLLALQQEYVPSRVYLARPSDPAWFGFRCRVAAEAKHAAWERPDGSTATSSGDKASLMAELFAKKMKVGDPERPAPVLPQETDRVISSVSVTAGQVERLLSALDAGKAVGPDDISPRLLKNCAKELSGPLSAVFTSCLMECNGNLRHARPGNPRGVAALRGARVGTEGAKGRAARG
ncbi:uncharacterized protein LOC126985992 [Eriocheir sinensis]|uniref:uncharacterized protein LOC126985992 n=1 Tax=Eriocheir sinensis TaxID=95602 RepID=UPI0021C91679|nr:uncharacterized protein LOC126985992 [Eriocheir sinensis]